MLYSYIGPYVNNSLWQQTLQVHASSLLIDWLVFNANFSNNSAISWHEQIFLLT